MLSIHQKHSGLQTRLPTTYSHSCALHAVHAWHRPLHAGCTVDTNDLAIDPLAVLRGEEADNASDVDWQTHAVHWRPGSGILVDLIVAQLLSTWNVLPAYCVVHVALDTTWCNAVYSDLLVTAIDGHAADEGLNGALGPGVGGMFGHALGLTGDGAHQNDAAADTKMLVCLPRNEELATSIDAEDTVEFLLGYILQMPERDNTRVGADNVELAEVLYGLVHELDSLGDVANISLDCDSVTTVALDVIDNLLCCVERVGVVHNDLCTAARELGSHRSTNASPRAGDKGDLPIEAGGLNGLWSRHLYFLRWWSRFGGDESLR